jgi:hypothetical protein
VKILILIEMEIDLITQIADLQATLIVIRLVASQLPDAGLTDAYLTLADMIEKLARDVDAAG